MAPSEVRPPADNRGAEEKTPRQMLSGVRVDESADAGADNAKCPLCAIVVERRRRPQPQPLCGRCAGPAGPEGAWCEGCIRECREYTCWLDSGAAS
jgi:hypothetical protein